MKNIISFSLWGKDLKYCRGAIENIKLQPLIYPGWTCRFYVDCSIPTDTINELLDYGVEVIINELSDGYKGLFWRFEPAFDSTIDRFIVRDCDSRLNIREADAVQEWVQSDLPFHSMRDHQGHGIPVLGAMWGAKSNFILNFKDMYFDFLKQVADGPVVKRAKYFYTDQIFLNQVIWPLMKDRAMVHDDLKRFSGNENTFRVKLPGDQFVGQQWGEDNEPLKVPV